MSGNETGCLVLIRHGDRTCSLRFRAAVTRIGFRRWREAGSAGYAKPAARTRDEQARHAWFTDVLHRSVDGV